MGKKSQPTRQYIAMYYLLQRPKTTLMGFLGLVIFGILAYTQLPLSLMPATDVPRLQVEVVYPQGSPALLEQTVMRALRLSMQGLYGLENMESTAATGAAQLRLTFSFGTDMQLAYLEANEKVDQAMAQMPLDMERPIVRRIDPTDLPIMRVQLKSSEYSWLELSDVALFVIRRRLEQVPGVAFVADNGMVQPLFRIVPNAEKMVVLGVDESDIQQSLERANASLQQVKARSGIYEFDVKFDNLLTNPENLHQLALQAKNGVPVLLSDVAAISYSYARPLGMHLYNGDTAIVFAIHKQAEANLPQLNRQLETVLAEMQAEYPKLVIEQTQNQTALLMESLWQLILALTVGALFSVGILLLFDREIMSSLLMGMIIPVSLAIAGAGLYLAGLSLNIISLSGMILGVGLMIDNGIILLDNISRKRSEGESLLASCATGAGELAPALLSSTLTTVCVFIPLISRSGLAGELFQEQVFTLTIVLVASLAVALLLLPVVYTVFKPGKSLKESRAQVILSNFYAHSLHSPSWRWGVPLSVILICGVWAAWLVPKTNLPFIPGTALEASWEWGAPLSIEESKEALQSVLTLLEDVTTWEADIGRSNLWEESNNSQQQVRLYVRFRSEEAMELAKKLLQESRFALAYQPTNVRVTLAKNPYDQVFASDQPFLVLKFRSAMDIPLSLEELPIVLRTQMAAGEGFQFQKAIEMGLREDRMQRYGLTATQLTEKIRVALDDQLATQVSTVSRQVPIVIRGEAVSGEDILQKHTIKVNDSLAYPLSYFIQPLPAQSPRYIKADRAGIYQDLHVGRMTSIDLKGLIEEAKIFAQQKGYLLGVEGAFSKEQSNLISLGVSLLFAALLLFIVLTAQFESFALPLIILAEIPLSMAGSILVLFVTGQSLNIASLLGILIMLGIIVNDSILKIDAINRYRKGGMPVFEAVHKASTAKLKPIVMTSLTTLLAMVPVLFGSGFGTAIQTPLALAVMGGLTVGTVCSLYLVPWLYIKFSKNN